MTNEPHPYPEPRFWRIAPPVTAAVLAAVGFVVMLVVPAEPARTVALVVVLAVQVSLMVGRGIVLRRSGRTADRPVYWHQFFFAWSFFTSGTHLLGSDDSTLTAAIDVCSGLVFAVLLVGAFLLMARAPRRRTGRPTRS